MKPHLRFRSLLPLMQSVCTTPHWKEVHQGSTHLRKASRPAAGRMVVAVFSRGCTQMRSCDCSFWSSSSTTLAAEGWQSARGVTLPSGTCRREGGRGSEDIIYNWWG